MRLGDVKNLLQCGMLIVCLALVNSMMPAHAKYKTSANFYSPASPIYGSSQLANELNYLISSAGNSASIGIYVKSMRSGAALYTRNINQPMTPASTLKILTAEAALLYLSPNYRFSTQLLTDAKGVKNGV